MGLRHAMETLAAEWPDIRAQLPPDRAAALTELVSELTAEAVPETSVEIAEEIADLLGDVLPVEHPFRRALAVSESRYALGAGPTDWLGVVAKLRVDAPSGEEIRLRVKERLLSAPALTAAELLARGQDPEDAGLIRLDRADGVAQWPAFQFGSDVVRKVNAILEADKDPWGAADWWLGHNGWLRDTPARLIGRVDDQDLVDAARYERSEG